jgi:hypothetical protein
MTTKPISIAFHIGAHKTATTHLQRSLRHARDALVEKGVRYYGPDSFRMPGRTIQGRFGFPFKASATPAKRTPQDELAFLIKDGHRLLLSEENFIGSLNHPRGLAVKDRYRGAGSRLGSLAQAIGQEVDVCLALRRPTGFINAAYCQMLMSGQVMPIAAFQQRNPIGSVDWLDLVSRLRSTEGIGRLTVWRYEDYRVIFPQITAALVGDDAADLVAPVDRLIHPSLSAAAVAEVLQNTAILPLEEIGSAARKTFPVEDGHDAFDGFHDDDHALGDAAYAKQINAIAQMSGVTLLQPPQA